MGQDGDRAARYALLANSVRPIHHVTQAQLLGAQFVRPVLRIDLPFIEVVNLRDFSKITTEEFASYSAFRDFLRQSFLEMDMSLNAVQSDRELLKLGLQIKDHVRSVRSEMETARRKTP